MTDAGAPPVAAVTIGTRSSPLALRQAETVVALLQRAWPGLSCALRPFVTTGDRSQARGTPLPEIGGKGLFTLELEQALREGEIDLAVHSLKDLPVEDPVGLLVGAVPSREDPSDVLVTRDGLTLSTLAAGAVVGTSSLRRAAQLLAARPDLDVRPVRGNVDTRVRKVRAGELDAVVLAAAGLRRLGLGDAGGEALTPEVMLPAPGQGALALQCRSGDGSTLALLAPLEDHATRAAVDAERAFLQGLGGGCSAPVGALGIASPDGVRVRLAGLVAAPHGGDVVRVAGEGAAAEVGPRLAADALRDGAATILAAVTGRPLAGRRVAVTRPRDRAQGLARRLEARGATAVVVPLIAVEPLEHDGALDEALRRLGDYDWLVLTSVNAVRAVADRLPALDPPSPSLATRCYKRSPRVAVVGPATAAEARRRGLEPDVMPERAEAAAVPDALGVVEGLRVLLPQADIAAPALADELRRRGARVDVVAAYRTVAVEPPADELDELRRGVDAIVLASGSAARSLAALAERDPGVRASVESAVLVCIGPSTAGACTQVGLTVGIVAGEPGDDGVVGALVDHVRETEQ